MWLFAGYVLSMLIAEIMYRVSFELHNSDESVSERLDEWTASLKVCPKCGIRINPYCDVHKEGFREGKRTERPAAAIIVLMLLGPLTITAFTFSLISGHASNYLVTRIQNSQAKQRLRQESLVRIEAEVQKEMKQISAELGF